MSSLPFTRLTIAARKSDLARLQAYQVGAAIESQARRLGSTVAVRYEFRSSLGDRNSEDPLWKMPERGVFTEDFVRDLESGQADLVVHSWKDLPTAPRPNTAIVATLARADARDVLLVKRAAWDRGGKTVFSILTSSPRRAYNLGPLLEWALPWPSGQPQPLEFLPVRGNIATRVRKLIESESADALVVAKAALDRLVLAGSDAAFLPPHERAIFKSGADELKQFLRQTRIMVLPLRENPTAPAQGALAIEIRRDRQDLAKFFAALNSTDDAICVEREREVLAAYGGGCHQKIGVSVLKRAYGEVEFLRGLTDAGERLDRSELRKSGWTEGTPALTPENVYVAQSDGSVRVPLQRSPLPPADAYFVARNEAWPEGAAQGESLIWAAGSSTWRKLAARGLWVSGSSEGLGESEKQGLDGLFDRALRWQPLSHIGAPEHETGDRAHAAYELELAPLTEKQLAALKQARVYYWPSASLFQQSLRACPEIVARWHASGPGRTAEAIRQALNEAKIDQSHHAVFLNSHDFLAYLATQTATDS